MPTPSQYKDVFQHADVAAFVADASTCPERTPSKWTYGTTFKNRQETTAALLSGVSTKIVRDVSDSLRGSLELAMEASDMHGLSRRRRRVWSDQGEPDTDRVLDRRELWAGESRPGKQMRVFKIGLNVWMSCNNTERDFGELVGTACAIADTIAKLGYGSEIVAMFAGTHAYNYDRGFVYIFPVKKAHEPLDIQAVGSIAAPGFMRDLGFSLGDRDLSASAWNGPCYVNEEELKKVVGVDYLITRSWRNMGQQSMIEGIRKIIGAA